MTISLLFIIKMIHISLLLEKDPHLFITGKKKHTHNLLKIYKMILIRERINNLHLMTECKLRFTVKI